MNRKLFRSTAFIHTAKKIVKKNPEFAEDLRQCLKLLEEDAFHPTLKTHKLKGLLSGSWAASAGYNLRVIFSLVDYQDSKAILLQAVGTHDEVY